MVQQTAVEWLVDKVTDMIHESNHIELVSLLEQAKQMEKEQTEISDIGKDTADYIDRHIIESMKELAIEGFKPQTPEISDEEIEKKANNWCTVELDEDGFVRLHDYYDLHELPAFIAGAKWMKEQILNQNK